MTPALVPPPAPRRSPPAADVPPAAVLVANQPEWSVGDLASALKRTLEDAFGHVRLGGIGDRLAHEIETRTGAEARAVVLGHIQRGGTPSAFDRWLASRFGLHAIDAVAEEKWGMMTALRGTDIVMVPLAEATKELKVVDPALYAEAEVFFG